MLETGHAVEPVDWDQQKPHGQCHAPPSKEQWSTRSGPSGVYRHNACLLPVPSPLSLLLFLLLLFFHQPQSPPSPFLFFSPAFSAFTSSSFFTCLFSLSWPQSQTSSFLIGRYTHTHTHTHTNNKLAFNKTRIRSHHKEFPIVSMTTRITGAVRDSSKSWTLPVFESQGWRIPCRMPERLPGESGLRHEYKHLSVHSVNLQCEPLFSRGP